MIGRVVWPPGQTGAEDAVRIEGSFSTKIPYPPDLGGPDARQAWQKKWSQTEAGKATCSYLIEAGPDGRFRVDDVLPGTYVIRLRATRASSLPEEIRGATIGVLTHEFTVPESPAGTYDPLDLGELKLRGEDSPEHRAETGG